MRTKCKNNYWKGTIVQYVVISYTGVASNHDCCIVLINYALMNYGIIISYTGMIVSVFSYLKIRLLS